MKVVCDFLPTDYKSFILDTKALFVGLGLLAVTVVLSGLTLTTYKARASRLKRVLQGQQSEKSNLDASLNKTRYPQNRIRALVNKFTFIQQALGRRDFPYLRFYQSLEEAVPISEEDGKRRVAIENLRQISGSSYSLVGLARHWEDVLKFERTMNESKWKGKNNFSGVQVFKIAANKKGSFEFDMKFSFNP